MGTIVHIDGSKIKRLREDRGLTQLYLATVVGVTTDTISRWENRRYPTIKKENAQKLAEALDVPLEDLLDNSGSTDGGGVTSDAGPRKKFINRDLLTGLTGHERKTLLTEAPVLLALCFACVFLIVSLNFFEVEDVPALQAVRSLPPHTAPGTVFPVVITVSGSPESPLSILLRDTLSCECRTTVPVAGSTTTRYGKNPRWIGRINGVTTSFGYQVQAPEEMKGGEEITFHGDFVTRKNTKIGGKIGGKGKIVIAPFHWADANRDRSISDEEILAVYEEFGAAEKSGFSFETVEELWLAGHYSWNRKKHAFVPENGAAGRAEHN